MAISDGGATIDHIDLGDAKFVWTCVVPLMEFLGGEFVCEQLDARFALPPGSALMVAARDLIHRSGTVASGHRRIITGFIDRNLALHAGFGRAEFSWEWDRWEKWVDHATALRVSDFGKRKKWGPGGWQKGQSKRKASKGGLAGKRSTAVLPTVPTRRGPWVDAGEACIGERVARRSRADRERLG